MAKKKSANNSNTQSLLQVLNVKNVFDNEKFVFFSGIVLLAIAVFFIMSFISFFSTCEADQSLILSPQKDDLLNTQREFLNSCGSIGAYVSYFCIKQCFGIPAFIIPLYMILVAVNVMHAYDVKLLKSFLVLSIVMIWFSVALAKFVTPLFSSTCYNPGGDHGKYIVQFIEALSGTTGLTAILAITAIGFLTYFSAKTIVIIRKCLNPETFRKRIQFSISYGNGDAETEEVKDKELASFSTDIAEEVPSDIAEEPQDMDNSFGDENSEMAEPRELIDEITLDDTEDTNRKETAQTDLDNGVTMEIEVPQEQEKATEASNDTALESLAPYDPKKDLENYHYPTLELLKKYESNTNPSIDREEQNNNAKRITEVLRNFGVEISSIKATVGPTITLYEITPAQGVRISKIRNLEDDIALSLSALGIRIIAPIPGKGTIGIEVPNAKPNIVSMESILNSKKFQETTMELPCAIGKTITNEVFMFDLARIPHLLVAGATGQGKSVGLNAIITSLLYKKHPAEMKVVLIDPKKVEFSIYSTISKHFLAMVPDDNNEPIITDKDKVIYTLNSLCKEMDTRYDLLKEAGARNIKEYNQKFVARKLNPEKGHHYMPYIVVVIDEFGDLILTAGKEIELPIARIAQLARAIGIHMIIATQRPTTTIITGNIKANFPGRMAFKVSAMVDSKTILDRPGANQLVGKGDMLFLNGNDPVRVQCAFVDTDEVERINQFISQQQGYVSTFELPIPDSNEGDALAGGSIDMQSVDSLFEEAARLIVLNQSGSTSLIQRKFSIGYNRAGRLMDQLEKAGVVGSAMGAKPREVLIQDEVSLEKLLSAWR